MKESLSERRLVENEAFFRVPNEKVAHGLMELRAMAEATNQTDLLHDLDLPIEFYCECSDEKCRQRVTLRAGQYIDLHENNRQFVLLPGHNVPETEDIVHATSTYIVVEKHASAPARADRLHPTDLHHT